MARVYIGGSCIVSVISTRDSVNESTSLLLLRDDLRVLSHLASHLSLLLTLAPGRSRRRPAEPSQVLRRSSTTTRTAASPRRRVCQLDVLREPADSFAVSLSHDDGAHEDLDGPDALQGNLALAGSLVHAELVAQLVLGNGVGVVDLVAEDNKGHLG